MTVQGVGDSGGNSRIRRFPFRDELRASFSHVIGVSKWVTTRQGGSSEIFEMMIMMMMMMMIMMMMTTTAIIMTVT